MNNNVNENLIGGNSGTNEQFIENILKQTYGKLGPILDKSEMHDAIDQCIASSISDKGIQELRNLTNICSKYSFISFIKHIYLLPNRIDSIPIYLGIIIGFLILIILLLLTILSKMFFN